MDADKKIVVYFCSWAVYRRDFGEFKISDIDPQLCTHIIYCFVGINADGRLRVMDNWADLPNGLDGYGKFTRLREKSPRTKYMIAIGGWNEGSIKFSQVAGNPRARSNFVKNVVNFLKYYHFDGLDVDWEYPNQRGGRPSDKENFVALLRELRQAFNLYGLILSVAVAAAESSASKSYNIREVSQYVHFINLMAYDFNGSWNPKTGLNAPMYASPRESGDQPKLNMDSAVRYWIDQGASRDKLVLGIPAYGRSFTLADPGNNGIGAPTIGPGNSGLYTQTAGLLGYNEICANLCQGDRTWKIIYDQQVPYAFKDNQWVGYDDISSVWKKGDYININGLGGAMLWSVDTDNIHGPHEKFSLLNTLNRVLKNGSWRWS